MKVVSCYRNYFPGSIHLIDGKESLMGSPIKNTYNDGMCSDITKLNPLISKECQ
jgi:hypothetical protein